MQRRIYRALLLVLPRHRRARYGEEMAAVFEEVVGGARRTAGWTGVATAWAREAVGILRFSLRELASRLVRRIEGGSLGVSGGRWNLPAEARWAWRSVRARGWRAVFVVGLLSVALAANATMFSVVDSLLLQTQPFPDAHRIVRLRQEYGEGVRVDNALRARLLDDWRGQTDIFSGVAGYLEKNVFLTGSGFDERIDTADVTVDFLTVLGVAPRWGRGFAEADLDDPAGFPVVVSESLARRQFGSPELAVGRQISASAGPHLVVGVMPRTFAFPRVGFEIWRLMSVGGPLTRSFGGPPLMARLAAGVTPERLEALLHQRSPDVGAGRGVAGYTVTASPFTRAVPAGTRRTLLVTLLGAAFCLLLAACANAASVELAHALRRRHTAAVHLALGARPASLARVAALEGCLLVGAALAAGLALTRVGISVVHTHLPGSLLGGTANPVDLDLRVVGFAVAASIVVWVLAALPTVLAAAEIDLSTILRTEGRTASVSRRGATLRGGLTLAQVASATLLTVGGMLYARSYVELLAVDKGFDSSGLAVASASAPATYFTSMEDQTSFTERLEEALGRVPGVLGVTTSSPPPHLGDSPSETTLQVDGRVVDPPVHLGQKWVDAQYFDVVGLPLRAGRYLEPGDPAGSVVVSESFASRFWPDEAAVGHLFTGTGNGPYADSGPFRVVGVVGDFRSDRTRMPGPTDTRLFMYSLWSHLPPSVRRPRPTEPQIDTGGSFRIVSVTLRLDGPERAPAVMAAARQLAPRLPFRLTFVDDLYADQNTETLLAVQIVGSFGVLALVVSLAGIYGVMAFLVAGRTREIGIRMALGADRQAIGRMVLGSSARLVLWGAAVGSGAALVASHWIESQLFGVSPSDPFTYLGVSAAVVVTALLATWQPARQAARVDPAVTLRAE